MKGSLVFPWVVEIQPTTTPCLVHPLRESRWNVRGWREHRHQHRVYPSWCLARRYRRQTSERRLQRQGRAVLLLLHPPPQNPGLDLPSVPHRKSIHRIPISEMKIANTNAGEDSTIPTLFGMHCASSGQNSPSGGGSRRTRNTRRRVISR